MNKGVTYSSDLAADCVFPFSVQCCCSFLSAPPKLKISVVFLSKLIEPLLTSPVTMPAKLAPLTEEERSCLAVLLHRAKAHGEFEYMTGPRLDSGPELDFEADALFPDLGAMSDASKRRMDDEGYQAKTGRVKQAPIQPSGKSTSPTLPSDVSSLEDWGTTIMKIGKFEKAGLSYQELAASTQKDTQKYLSWLMKSLNDSFNPQFHDLVSYLHATEYGKSASSSGFVRERK